MLGEQPTGQDIGNCGERMVAGSGGWGYYAHLSLYALAAKMVAGQRVLEAGCGTGYGSAYLSTHNPRSLYACDGSADAVAYCRNIYADAGVTFETVDLGQPLPYPDQAFDFIFSSNVMEHIGPIDSFLSECRRIIAPTGSFFIAVPPNHSPGALEENIRNIFHITNLTPLGWYTKVSRYFGKVRSFRHWPNGVYAPEPRVLADIPLPPEQTTIRETDFALEEMPIDALNTLPQNITAVFLASEPREQILPEDIREHVPQAWCAGAIVSKVIQSEREIARAAQSEATELRASLAAFAGEGKLKQAHAAIGNFGSHQDQILALLQQQQHQIAKILKVAKTAKTLLVPVEAAGRLVRAVRGRGRNKST